MVIIKKFILEILLAFLYDIKDGNFNKEREYEKRLKKTEKELENRKKYNNNIRRYKQYLNDLKKILFSDKNHQAKA